MIDYKDFLPLVKELTYQNVVTDEDEELSKAITEDEIIDFICNEQITEQIKSMLMDKKNHDFETQFSVFRKNGTYYFLTNPDDEVGYHPVDDKADLERLKEKFENLIRNALCDYDIELDITFQHYDFFIHIEVV